MRMHLRTFSRLFMLLSGAPFLVALAPVPGLVPFCQTFVRCCQATYCLCPPFFYHYRATAKKDSFHPSTPQLGTQSWNPGSQTQRQGASTRRYLIVRAERG